MTNPFVSVHIISKETSKLGQKFLEGCFTSLYNSRYPNEIVLVDNGSFKYIFDEVYEVWKPKFKEFDCDFKLVNTDYGDFELRNICLQHTNPCSDWIHWIDTDEVYYEEDLSFLKDYIMPEHRGAGVMWSYFYHFMITPFQVQVTPQKVRAGEPLNIDDYRSSKDNIFAYNKNLVWKGKVHEHMYNVNDDRNIQTGVEYLHYGYCRPQLVTFVKWLKYALLEFGHIGMYKDETITLEYNGVKQDVQVEHLRDWRTPCSMIWDRWMYCRPYPNLEMQTKQHIPDGSKHIIGDCKSNSDWIRYIDKLDPNVNDYMRAWLKKKREMGTWKKTLDWVVEDLQQRNWNI